jgi:hypothetical protein
MKKRKKRQEVFAIWDVDEIGPDEDGEALPDYVHISTGIGDGQSMGYFLSDPGAVLHVKRQKSGGYRVTFSAPALAVDLAPGYWLSPCTLWPGEVEASKWGVREARP